MNRPWQIWLAFALCLTVVLAATGWVSLTALRLDRAQADARRRAKLEENVRLALWRMDSAVSPLIARESARPYFTYTAFYPPGRAYTRMFEEILEGEVLLPSPLLTELTPNVLLHFQLEPDGTLTSPQVPLGNMRDLAEARRYTTPEKIQEAGARLDGLRKLVGTKELLTALVLDSASFNVAETEPQTTDGRKVTSEVVQRLRSNVEYVARRQYQQEAQNKALDEVSNVLQLLTTAITGDVMRPVWVSDTLLLARKVTVGEKSYIQGCWLDWPAIRTALLGGVGDLLPQAKLEPVSLSGPQAAERLLASLPVRLVPGDIPAGDGDGFSPILLSLVIAWVCVVLAAGAVALVLSGTVSLSERRGAFVSAVTHELRTPLTTFQMYTEMLENDMVTEESRRKEYLGTLRTEAERLGHLVENVLAYARLERGSARGRIEAVGVRDLVDRSRDVLSARATQADMELVVELSEPGASRAVRADATAVEQILFNLVDNACKYAATADDRRIHLRLAASATAAQLSVCDHGPGIAREEARRLFRPFRKSARDAANSAPGVGLGLALSRRLARQMHGDLTLDTNTPEGACFVLTLPLAPR